MNINVNGLFNPENRFWAFMDKIMNLFVLGILWALFSLPLITIGAATTALFQYTLKLTRDEEGYIWRTFRRGFVENLLQSTILWIGMAAVGAFLVFDLYCCQFLPLPGMGKWIARGLLGSLILVYALTIIYIFPMVAFFKTTLKKAVSHSFIMAVGNLYVSVTVLVIYGVAAVATYFIPVLFMIWFAIASYVASHLFGYVFRKYINDEEEVPNYEGEN